LAALFQNFVLAAERVANRCRNGPDASRAAHILMNDQPSRATRGRFVGPEANEIGRRITEEAREFRDARVFRSGFKLDEWIIAAQRDARAFQ